MLKSTPPYTDSHIMCQEQALRLAKQQLSDLNDYRQKMNKETEETNEVRKFYPVLFLCVCASLSLSLFFFYVALFN